MTLDNLGGTEHIIIISPLKPCKWRSQHLGFSPKGGRMRNSPQSLTKENISLSCPAGKSHFHFYKAKEERGNRASSDSVINLKERLLLSLLMKILKK